MDSSPVHSVVLGHKRNGMDVSKRAAWHSLCLGFRPRCLGNWRLSFCEVINYTYSSLCFLCSAFVFRCSSCGLSFSRLVVFLHRIKKAARGKYSSAHFPTVGDVARAALGGTVHAGSWSVCSFCEQHRSVFSHAVEHCFGVASLGWWSVWL